MTERNVKKRKKRKEKSPQESNPDKESDPDKENSSNWLQRIDTDKDVLLDEESAVSAFMEVFSDTDEDEEEEEDEEE